MKINRSPLVALTMWLVAGALPGAEPRDFDEPVTRNALELERVSGGPVKVVRSRLHGAATFMAMEAGRSVSVNAPANASAAARAESFLASHGAALGLKDRSQTRVKRVHPVDETGMEHVRFEQVHRGVPVTAGEVIVHLRGNGVVAVNAKTLPNLDAVDTLPAVTAEQALAAARDLLAKHLGVANAQMSEPRLEIFNRGLLEGTHRPTHLAWLIEARRFDLRQRIWIDAHTGGVLLHFSQLAHALNRRVHDAMNTSALPGTLVRSEGGPPAVNPEANTAYDLSGAVYDYFLTQHGRDSYDDAGAAIVSTVDYCPAACPYVNARWTGTQMVYGDRFIHDDVVAHEITHAVTEHSANLFYFMQSGALNESYSDIFGETIDLLTPSGNDSAEARWLIGEDLSIGAIRSMSDPTRFGDAGKVSDPELICNPTGYGEAGDWAGVHSNSGVPNHAFALMVDGGSYNGYNISGIGLAKAARIQYRALTTYLVSGSDFADNYHALKQACRDLIGIDGITAADCAEVDKALDAVEMARPWPCVPEPPELPPFCSPAHTLADLIFDDFEIGSGAWSLDLAGWHRTNYFSGGGRSHLHGLDRPMTGDTRATLSTNLAIPAPGSLTFLQFNHAWGFESDATRNYDGGVIEYSTNNGVAWSDAGNLIVAGPAYNGLIQSGLGNPLDNRLGYIGKSLDYRTTRLDLTSLAGRLVRIRFRIGTDVGVADYGWFIDDVRFYQCLERPDAPPFIASSPESRTTNEGTNVTFTVTAYGGRPLTYEWRKHGTALANQTNAALTLTNLTAADTADYSVVVSNAFGVLTSAVASLTVRTIPRLVTPVPPLQLTAVLGETVTLNVETTGTLPIGYRWRHIRTNGSGANVTNFVLNQNTCFLTFTVGTNSAGAYTIVLTNVVQPASAVQRTNTLLTVLADTDADGLPDDWETAYSTAANATEDADLDGLTNWQEYRAGTDPTNALSYLKVDSISLASGTRLTFFATSNKTYTVESRDALGPGPWNRLADVLASPANRVVEILDTNAPTPQRFYRLATPRTP